MKTFEDKLEEEDTAYTERIEELRQ